MKSSAEIALLYKISELARRYYMRPSEADAELTHQSEDKGFEFGCYQLEFSGITRAKHDNFDRMFEALGGDPDADDAYTLKGEHLRDLEDIVDHALSLAPRARSR